MNAAKFAPQRERWRRALLFAVAFAAAPGALAAGDSADSGPATVETAAAVVWTGAQDLASFALGLAGVEYRFGGSTPERGLDCSGLVHYVFEHVTGMALPRTAKALSRLGTKVSLGDLEPGDLVFFNTHRFAFSHVGIYLGEDRFIHAPASGGEVRVESLRADYWVRRYNGARRVITPPG